MLLVPFLAAVLCVAASHVRSFPPVYDNAFIYDNVASALSLRVQLLFQYCHSFVGLKTSAFRSSCGM